MRTVPIPQIQDHQVLIKGVLLMETTYQYSKFSTVSCCGTYPYAQSWIVAERLQQAFADLIATSTMECPS